jgi:hypothetical protein
LSIDPELETNATIHQPQKWNRYSYTLNNPFKYTDPNGREENYFGGGTVINNSSQVIYIAFDADQMSSGSRNRDVIIPLQPGESSIAFTFDADAVIVSTGQSISGATDGSFKVSAGTVEIDDAGKGRLVLKGNQAYFAMHCCCTALVSSTLNRQLLPPLYPQPLTTDELLEFSW